MPASVVQCTAAEMKNGWPDKIQRFAFVEGGCQDGCEVYEEQRGPEKELVTPVGSVNNWSLFVSWWVLIKV